MDTTGINAAIKREREKLRRYEESVAATKALIELLEKELEKPVKPK